MLFYHILYTDDGLSDTQITAIVLGVTGGVLLIGLFSLLFCFLITYYKQKRQKYFYSTENDRTKFNPPSPVPVFPEAILRERRLRAGQGTLEGSGTTHPYNRGSTLPSSVQRVIRSPRMMSIPSTYGFSWDTYDLDDSSSVTSTSDEMYMTDDERRMDHLLGVIRNSPYIHVSLYNSSHTEKPEQGTPI